MRENSGLNFLIYCEPIERFQNRSNVMNFYTSIERHCFAVKLRKSWKVVSINPARHSLTPDSRHLFISYLFFKPVYTPCLFISTFWRDYDQALIAILGSCASKNTFKQQNQTVSFETLFLRIYSWVSTACWVRWT